MKSLTYENALNRAGVAWEYREEVSLEDINTDRGLRNQARIFMPLDDELVERYRERKAAGDEFPPVVLWRPSQRSKYVPVDGNNRLAAYTKVHRCKATDAYVLLTEDEKVVDFLTWTFNNEVNGKRLTPEEDLQHALTLVRKHNYSIVDVATACRVKKWQLTQKLAALEVREAADQAGVKHYAELTDPKLQNLHPLKDAGEEVLVKAVEVVGRTAASEADTRELVKEVRKARTIPEKMKILEEYKDRPEARARQAETRNGAIKRPRPAPRDRVEQLLRELHRLLDAHADEALAPVGESAKRQCRIFANEVIGRLRRLYKVHEEATT